MPELPEVETTRRGLEPHVVGRRIRAVLVREAKLRLPVPNALRGIVGDRITAIRRRAKYLIFELAGGRQILVHLGMTGSLRVCRPAAPHRKHDHVALTLAGGRQVRFHDPRRFGVVLMVPDAPAHPLLRALGPEPLAAEFDPDHLRHACRTRQAAIKTVIMDGKVVVGVGNIYASEALFRAGVRPTAPAGRIGAARLARLVAAIKEVLAEAIAAGGTTLQDFRGADGKPGAFRAHLRMYGRAGQPCPVCGRAIRRQVVAGRATYWCARCQR